MTPDERINAAWTNLFVGCEPSLELRQLWRDSIIAAIEEDRKTRPHVFVGARDRWCEVCDEPDRDARHLPSREILRNSVAFAVEEKETRIRELEASLQLANFKLRRAVALLDKAAVVEVDAIEMQLQIAEEKAISFANGVKTEREACLGIAANKTPVTGRNTAVEIYDEIRARK